MLLTSPARSLGSSARMRGGSGLSPADPPRATPAKMLIVPSKTTQSGVKWVELDETPQTTTAGSAQTSLVDTGTSFAASRGAPRLSFHIDSPVVSHSSRSPAVSEGPDIGERVPLEEDGGAEDAEKVYSWTNYEVGPVGIDASKPKNPGQNPRIGIDIGGVLTREGDGTGFNGGDEWDHLWESPGAFDAVGKILSVFGPENTFIVSKVSPGKTIHRKVEKWLHETIGFCQKTGFLKENIIYVPKVDGPDGKGPAAEQLGLAFFIDDKMEALNSVFSDDHGNSGYLVERWGGTLYHFAKGGCGREEPQVDMDDVKPMMRRYYHATCNWGQVLDHLRTHLPRCLKDNADLLTPLPDLDKVIEERAKAQPSNTSTVRAKEERPPWYQGSPVAALVAQKDEPGRKKLNLKPRDPTLGTAAALSSSANRRGMSQPAPKSPTQITSQSKRATAPQIDPITGRTKLVLKPRDPVLATAAPQPQPQPVARVQPVSQPAWQAQPQTQPQASAVAAKASAPIPATVMAAPRSAMQVDPSGGRPRLVLKKREELVAAPVSMQAAPAVHAVSPRHAVAAPRLAQPRVVVPAAAALQRDSAGGRPKLLLKPRTAPVLAQ